LQLLPRLYAACPGSGVVASRRVPANLGVLQLRHRGHSRSTQGNDALQLALRLFCCLSGRKLGFLRGQHVVTDRGVIEAYKEFAFANRVPVVFEHSRDHRRNLGAQIGA
jgi:hypothetical protein